MKRHFKGPGILNRPMNLETSLMMKCCENQIKCIDNSGDFESLLERSVNWALFYDLIIHHKVYPLVYRELARLNHHCVPPLILNKIKTKFNKNRFSMLKLKGELLFLLEIMDESGIKAIPLKGPVLAEKLYKDISFRASIDLDILVDETQVILADDILRNNGFKRVSPVFELHGRHYDWYLYYEHHFSYVSKERGVLVELHWRYFKMRQLYGGSFNEIQKRLVQNSIHGRKITTLSSQENFLYLCVHGSVHSWFKLFWLCDIGAFMVNYPELDYEVIVKEALIAGIERPVKQAFVLTAMFFNLPIPSKIDEMPVSSKAMNKLLKKTAHDFFGKKNNPHLINGLHRIRLLALKKDWKYKIQGCIGSLGTFHKDFRLVPFLGDVKFFNLLLQPFFWFWRFYSKKKG